MFRKERKKFVHRYQATTEKWLQKAPKEKGSKHAKWLQNQHAKRSPSPISFGVVNSRQSRLLRCNHVACCLY